MSTDFRNRQVWTYPKADKDGVWYHNNKRLIMNILSESEKQEYLDKMLKTQ